MDAVSDGATDSERRWRRSVSVDDRGFIVKFGVSVAMLMIWLFKSNDGLRVVVRSEHLEVHKTSEIAYEIDLELAGPWSRKMINSTNESLCKPPCGLQQDLMHAGQL
jgi:hypothetical protein